MILGTNFNLHMDTQLQFQNQDRSIMNKGCPDSYFSAKQKPNEEKEDSVILKRKYFSKVLGVFLMFVMISLFSLQEVSAQCSTPSTRSYPTILLQSSGGVSGSNPLYMGPGYSYSFYVNSNSYFVIENVTSGRNIRISTCGSGYDSQITLRDWSTDTYLAYNDDNGVACTGNNASLDYSGNSSYPHVKVIINQFNCQTTTVNTYVTVTFTSQNLTPSDPSSISISSNPICSGNSTTLTANGAVGTVYWYTGGCGSNFIGTGNSISVSPSSSTSYYARNYNNGYWSNGCASTTVSVNPPAPSAPSSATGTPTSASTANISWSSSSNASTYYWVVSTNLGATYGTGSWYGSTSGTSTSISGLSPNTAYYLRVYANNSCGSSGYVTSSAFTTYPSDPTSISASSSTVCSGSSTTLTANGAIGTVYWYTGGCGSTQIGTGNSISVSPTSNTTYYARNNNGNWSSGCANTTISVNAAPAISVHPSTTPQSVCLNGTATALTVTASGAGLSYQWYSNASSSNSGGTLLNGATSSSYTPLTTTEGTLYYYCVVSGTCTPSVTSNVSGSITIVPSSIGGTASGSSTVCSGTNSSQLSLSGNTGSIQWQVSSDNSSFSDISGATSGTYTASNLTATRYYRAKVTNSPCTQAYSNTVTVTVNALPTVASITGTNTVCTQFTITLSNATSSGVWSSSNTGVATVNSSGVVTGVSAGTSNISYTVTDGNNCSNSASMTVSVSTSLVAPTSVSANPSTIQTGQSSNLRASSVGNTIYWYTASTGGTSVGNSSSGANFSVTPLITTTYYAEANSVQSFYLNSMSSTNSYSLEHSSYAGDDRGGIAVTSFYYYYTGDSYTVRYTMPGLTSPTSCTRRDGIFSDLGSGTLYTLWNGSTDPVYGTNTSSYTVSSFRTLNSDLSYGSVYVTLSSSVTMTQGNSAIYAGANFVILQSGTTFYRVDLPSGTVTNMGSYSINRYPSESWATWGIAEKNGTTYSVLYRETSTQNISRLNLSTGSSASFASFTSLSDMCSFTYAPWYNRWYFHHEGTSQFRSGDETAGYADASHTTSSAGCPSASRTAVTVTISNPPTVTTTTVSSINSTTATSGGDVTDQGGTTVSARGVCWSTSQNPTTSDSKTTDGTGTGSYTSDITGLTPGTLYYVRAYATNSVGTSYGSQASFTSYSPGTISGSQSICKGATPSQFTSTTAAVGMPTVTYQWQSSTDNVSFSDISGATSVTYQCGAVNAQTYYRRNATSGSVTLNSNVITVSMDAGLAAPTAVSATPSVIQSGQSANLNATSAGNEIKWYDAATTGSLLTTVSSGTNYSVSPGTTTTYYAEASPITCSDNTLANVLSSLNSNYTNIINQIPSRYSFSEGSSSNVIVDGGNDMYDNGNYLSTNNSSSFSYSDNAILSNTIFGTGGKYFTRKLDGLFVLAADMNSVNWFRVSGNYGSDGGGNTDAGSFTISVGCKTFNCFVSRVYNAGDPSINELFIIPANPSASQTAIGNTNVSDHTLNGISGSTRMYYLLYAGSSGGYISNTSAQNIATAFLTQTQAVINGGGSCPSATRTSVTVTVSNPPVVSTASISNVSSNSATCGGNVTSDGGSSVTARGVCWSTSQNPTISSSTTNDGSGTGSFTSSITGLTAGTTYYVRAYATNAQGTTYGTQQSVTPFQLGTFANITKTYGDASFTLVDPTSASTGAFTYTSDNTGVATISGNTVTITGAGTTTITATQAASGIYSSASTTATLTVNKSNQVITLNPLPIGSVALKDFVGTIQVSATSNSGLPVTISLGAGSAATLNGSNQLENIGQTGTVEINVTQTGNANYNPASISHSFDVVKSNQTITFNALTAQTYTPSLTVDLSTVATASSSLAVSYTVVSGPANLTGTTLNITGSGVVEITASQAGDAAYNPAPDASQTLTINKAASEISNFADINKTYGDADFTLAATGNSTGVISYSSDNSSVATIAGNTVTITGAGTATLTASLASDANYLSSDTSITLTVGKADQTITISGLPSDISLTDFVSTPIQISASSTSGLSVSLSLGSGSVATLNGTELQSTVSSGSVVVNASQAGNTNYNSATASANFTVSKSDQTISFAAPTSKMLGEADFDLVGSSSSALGLSYVSSDPNVATISGKTVTIIGVGTTQITASQSGNAYYNAASSVTQDFTVLSNGVSWTGAISTDWNEAGNWSNNQVPTSISNITISSTPINQPSVTSLPGNPAICNDLTVASGASVSVEPGKALTVNGTITLLGTQGLIVKSDSTGSGSLLDNGYSGAGTAKIEQYLPANTFHQLGIPISNTIQGGWGTGQTGNVFLYCSLDSYDETNDNYVGITGNDNVVPDRGFVTSYLNASNQPKMLRFTGNPNTGSKSFAMTKYGLGYNLIPNPYPSAIDWDASSGWDKSVASDNSIFIWNHANMQFATYNGFIGVNGGSRYIAPCQSFFVSSQGNGNIVMNNSVRVHESTTYLKSGTIPDNLIRLKVSGTTNSFNDETVVYFTTNLGSEGSEKWMTSEATAPSLYSEKYSKNYAINILPQTSQNQTVPVKFTAGVDGNYSIKATEIGVFSNVSTIILEDLKTGATQNLQSNPTYNFTSSKTDDASRFLLHFNTSTSIEENQSLKPYIYESDNTVYIRGKVNQIMIYNILGQVVKSVNSTEDYSSINLNGQAPGSYVVKVVVNNQVYTEKVVIK